MEDNILIEYANMKNRTIGLVTSTGWAKVDAFLWKLMFLSEIEKN